MTGQDWEALIHRYLDGKANRQEIAQLSRELESDGEMRLNYLRMANIHGALATIEEFDESRSASETRMLELVSQFEQYKPSPQKRRFQYALSAVTFLLLVIGVWTTWIFWPSSIVTITSIEGIVQWMGDGGKVIKDLKVGQSLTGGIIEARSRDSFLEFRFRDGSMLSASEGAVLTVTVTDQAQKSLRLRSGVLSAEVEKQATNRPMILITPSARFEILGTRFDVVTTEEHSKLSVQEGLVQAIRLSDGKSVQIGANQSTIVDIQSQSELVARRSDQSVSVWQADLEKDRKAGEGLFESPLHILRRQIRNALGRGELNRDQIPEVYGARIRAAMGKEDVVRAQPKSIRRGRLGDVVQMVTLNIRPDKPNPVVIADGSLFRVQGKVLVPTEIRIGFGAFGTSRPNADRFMTSRDVDGGFDLQIPVREFQNRRKPGGGTSAIGMEIFTWFCLTSDPGAELAISHVKLMPEIRVTIENNGYIQDMNTEPSRQ
ncbi:FecR family protein [Verrucomicrobia bacterium]|nr:FecR family protein [Verrucomicrobiota bacterium]